MSIQEEIFVNASDFFYLFRNVIAGDMEEIYVVKVRTDPDPARLYPSERRYSALTVGGLGAVHLLLAATSLLLGCLGLALQSDSCWTGRYGGGLWLGVAAALAGFAGILAWRR